MSKKNVRPYMAFAAGEGQSWILAPNGRTVAKTHSPRTTRRLLAVLNNGKVAQSDRFGDRKHEAPAGKVDGVYQIVSANGRLVVSCISRYVQLMLQERLNAGVPATPRRAYRKKVVEAAVPVAEMVVAAAPKRRPGRPPRAQVPVVAVQAKRTTSRTAPPPKFSPGYAGPAFSRAMANSM